MPEGAAAGRFTGLGGPGPTLRRHAGREIDAGRARGAVVALRTHRLLPACPQAGTRQTLRFAHSGASFARGPDTSPYPRMPDCSLSRCFLALIALTGACAPVQGPFVWVNDYRAAAESRVYAVGPEDVLSVLVWDAEKYSTRVKVRGDGQISLPLLNDIEVAGRTPAEIARIVEERMRKGNVLLNPHVTVAVEESRHATISVLGAVMHPGKYPLDAGNGVADALAAAGGLTEFAHKDRIFVIRKDPSPARIRFTLAALTSELGPAAVFRLRPGDVVFAED
ncbi:MAG: hypothetical protein NVS9B3_01640 [Gemmatimonadaceae bacterium]